MIDQPDEWAEALCNAVARDLSRHGPHQPFTDPTIPKLHNLTRLRQAGYGLVVPPSLWAWADELGPGEAAIPMVVDDTGRYFPFGFPCIIRSGSPSEDTAATSNAGRFLSLVVTEPAAFPASLAGVIAALPRDPAGRVQGVVFVQPFIEAEEAGVTFFDGFYYEETSARGTDQDLTAGRAGDRAAWARRARGRPRRMAPEDPSHPGLRHRRRVGIQPDPGDGLRRPARVVVPPGVRVVLQARPATLPDPPQRDAEPGQPQGDPERPAQPLDGRPA